MYFFILMILVTNNSLNLDINGLKILEVLAFNRWNFYFKLFYNLHFTPTEAFYLCQVGLQVIVSGGLRCLFIFIPFLSFQAYGYINICSTQPGDGMRPWCKARLPLLYSYIQSHYWYVTSFPYKYRHTIIFFFSFWIK